MVHHDPGDTDAPARSALPVTYAPPIPPADELPEADVHLWHQVTKLKDDLDQAGYYRQLHGNESWPLSTSYMHYGRAPGAAS
jgi:hypothetical protein